MNARRPFMAVFLLLVSVAWAEERHPDLALLFHVGFENSLEAATDAQRLTPGAAEGIQFVEGRAGKAAFFGENSFAEFRDLPKFDLRSATLEFWVKTDFERHDLNEHYFLRLLAANGKDGLDVFFSPPNCGFKAVMTAQGKKAEVFADNSVTANKWTHLVLAWETGESERSGLRLYINGKMRKVAPSLPLMGAPALIRLGCKSKEELDPARAAMDDLFLYNRCLSELQVLDLYRGVAQGAGKIEAIRKRLAEEDAAAKARLDDFLQNHRMAMIVGRTVGGLSETFFKSIGLPMPDKIHEKDFETADLSKYDLLFFPGGGGYVFTEKAQQRLRDFVAGGGGYVGICAGACAARAFGLVDCVYFPFRERGVVELELKPHPITEGFAPGRVTAVPHANGPFIEPSNDVQVVAFYRAGPPYAAIVVKEYGRGRIVVISPHPESDGDSRPLVRNSFYWAAKVIGSEQRPDSASTPR